MKKCLIWKIYILNISIDLLSVKEVYKVIVKLKKWKCKDVLIRYRLRNIGIYYFNKYSIEDMGIRRDVSFLENRLDS